MRGASMAGCMVAVAGSHAWALDSVSISVTGMRIQNGRNEARDSGAQLLTPGRRYSYRFSDNTTVRGVGLGLGSVFPQPTPLAQALDQLSPGASAGLSGAANDPDGQLPFDIPTTPFSGSSVVAGITVTFSMNAAAGIRQNGQAFFNLSNVVLQPALLVGYLEFTAGSVIITRHCLADYDLDGGVSIEDLLLFLQGFGEGAATADTTGDGGVTIEDLLEYLSAFSNGC